jgi:large subunit ribosomal protein L25
MSATLTAQNRGENTGKSTARKIRREGLIPAVVYSAGSEARSIKVNPSELVNIFRQTGDRNTILSIDVEGDAIDCVVREVQRNPVTRDILHADFYQVSGDDVLTVQVPLKSKGRAVGMSIGGRLRIIARTVTVRCQYQKIPAEVVYDITDMNIGDFVKASQLVVPEGVQLVYDNDYNVMNLYGRRAEVKKAEPAAKVKK